MSANIRLNHSKSPHSENHSYVNLNHGHTGSPSYQESNRSSRHSSAKMPVATPRATVSTKVDNPTRTPTNESLFQSNASLPQNWYSPPSSIKSVSRPPSVTDQNALPFRNHSKTNSMASRPLSVASSILPRSQPKLSTINENNMIVPIDQLLQLCSHPNEDIQANSLGYLQHLTFNNPDNKMEIRDYNGLPIIIAQISSDNNYVARAALGVLKNMSFTDLEMITTDIERLDGIQKLVDIIDGTEDFTQKELAIDILWNLSVKYNLKPVILTQVVPVLLKSVIIPDSGMFRQEAGNYVEGEEDIVWSTMLRNALGIIRNVSYENVEARSYLRKSDGLIDCIMYIIFQSGNREENEEMDEFNRIALIDTKIVENCVCILRNLTYAIQEVSDPDYFAKRQNNDQKANKVPKKSVMIAPPPPSDVQLGMELLWNSKYIVTALFPILKNGANAVTLEAAAGVTQNLTAGDWEPSKEMQTQFRLQLALPTLIELIDFGTDEVIRSSATALRNLVQEENCRLLVGKNGLQHLVDKIPFNSRSKPIEAHALAAVLSTIYVIILDQVEFMKDFVTIKGANRCLYIRDTDEFVINDDPFPDKVKMFSQCILNLLWKTSPVQDLMKNCKIKQSDINGTRNNTRSSAKVTIAEDTVSNNIRLHQSIVSDQNDRTGQYPRDQRYLRDSMSEIVSNRDLRERNSLAYATSSIPGYGDVRMPASNKRVSNVHNRLDTIHSTSHASSIVTGRSNKSQTPVPSYHTRENGSPQSNLDYRLQSPVANMPTSVRHNNGNISLNNRRTSDNSSNHSRSSNISKNSGTRHIVQPTNNRLSLNSNNSDLSYTYARPLKPKIIQNIPPSR